MIKIPVFVFAVLLFFNLDAAARVCAENAKTVAPILSDDARKTYDTKLAEARSEFEKNPASADALVWLGRRTAYPGNYREAIRIFTDGVARFPRDARFYRHRGHRLLTLRCFDDAVRDFETAAKLVRGKPDEIEPDGLPNARDIPTSTLQTNIHYHLGLAFYFKGDFNKAADSFMTSFNLARNDDMRVAAAHWVYMSAHRSGIKKLEKSAKQFIKKEIGDNADIVENDDYYKLVKLYQGKTKADELMKELGARADSLSNASLGYGLGNWFLYNGEKDKARAIFRRITAGNHWASFGYIASEAELK
jgi:tetratricopeptide (TPR) repeat protein